MIPPSKAKMFLAGERGHTEQDWFRSYNTFNFGNYRHEHKMPFGPLYVLNDDTLAPGRSFSLTVEEDSDIILVPVVGAVTCHDDAGNDTVTESGQVQVCAVKSGTTFSIGNPYEDALVNFVQLWVKRDTVPAGSRPQLFSFDIDSNKNKLIPLCPPAAGLQCYIGKFDGRAETTHRISIAGNGLFVFVIQGAFEVQYRLLHARDGMALWDIREAALEALSNDAIILMAEFPVSLL